MGPETFDCAGLVRYLYHSLFDINIFMGGYGRSTTTKLMTTYYGRLILFKENGYKELTLLKRGDVLFFHRQSLSDDTPRVDNKYPGHCGIYLGENKFIHASRPKQKVIISNFNYNEYWKEVLVGSKDYVSDKTLLLKYKKQ